MRKMKFLLAVIIIQLAGCGTYTTVREHADFAQAKRKIETIAVLPPDVEMIYIVFNGDNERMRDKESAVSQELNAAVQQLLTERNYACKDVNFETALSENSDMAFDLTQLKTAANTGVDAMYDQGAVTLEEPKYFNKTVGATANPFAEYAHADALLLVNYSGFEKSSGVVAKEMASSVLLGALTGQVVVAPISGAGASATLIDGTTGDILWTNTAALPGPVAAKDVLKATLASFRSKGVTASETLAGNSKHNSFTEPVSAQADSSQQNTSSTADTPPKEGRRKADAR